MFPRVLAPPKKTFFLFGPRGTGKSTWLGQHFSNAAVAIDLLNSTTYLRLLTKPDDLAVLTAHLPPGSWVVIDEVQRVPELLTEVHALYEKRKLQFALTGSSARRLRRGGADMLAGRALVRDMFGLVYPELPAAFDIESRLRWGSLPGLVAEPQYAADFLSSYVETYLRQEIMAEGLVRRLEPFARFLSVAGAMNGQVLNMQNVARESHVARATVDQYFEILEDTLLGTRLTPYRPGALVKEISHPKFYFFDAGVGRGAANLLAEPFDSVARGFALETILLSELRAYNHYRAKGRGIFYYHSEGGLEVDFIVELKRKTLQKPAEIICIEAKSASKWDPRWCKPIRSLAGKKALTVAKSMGVYLGKERLSYEGFDVWPLELFLEQLHAGMFF
ncbi:MAG: AAA family ATPase [Polyangiaceae bacterium]|nr:AAA family ATPase [Polyangiaceae bacterium]